MTPGSQHNSAFLNRFDSKRDKIDDTIDAGLAGSILGAGGTAITMRYRSRNLLGIAKRIAAGGGVGGAAGASTEVVTNVVKSRHEKRAAEKKVPVKKERKDNSTATLQKSLFRMTGLYGGAYLAARTGETLADHAQAIHQRRIKKNWDFRELSHKQSVDLVRKKMRPSDAGYDAYEKMSRGFGTTPSSFAKKHSKLKSAMFVMGLPVGAILGAGMSNSLAKKIWNEKKAEELQINGGHLKAEYVQTPVKQAEGKKVDPIKSYNKYIEKIAEMKNRDHKSISSSFLTGATYGAGASLIADGISVGSARRSMHYLKKNPAGTVHWLGRHLNDVNAKSKLRSLMERKPGRSAKWGLIAGGTAAGINAMRRLTDKN